MMTVELQAECAIVTLRPSGALCAEDLDLAKAVIDPFVTHRGNVTGLILLADSDSDGWDRFTVLPAGLSLVRNHHRKIKRIAVVGGAAGDSFLASISTHFSAAQVRAFSSGDRDRARQWLLRE